MAQPVVTFYTGDNSETVGQWDSGIVDAGTVSPEIQLMIWNNRGGSEDVSDMQETKITTTDNMGDNLDVVSEKWVECRRDDDTEDDFTPIGGTETKPLSAQGEDEGIIKGTANTGKVGDKANFCKVSLRVKPPLNSTAGVRDYKVRVSYYFT